MLIGESFVGEGVNAAHVNTVLGRRDGPVGTAFVTALATPTEGHAAFVAVARPGISITPPTLFVNKSKIAGRTHAHMTWGPAQAGVAEGVGLALESGLLDLGELDDLVLIAAVWVDPDADDAHEVYVNNREATSGALRAASEGRPTPDEFLAASKRPFNAFFDPT